MPLLTDPWFYTAAIPAVLLFGIAKGGFGGAFGVVAVPLMSLAISPVQAAAIMLPILCFMDLMTLWAWRGRWVWSELRVLLPASVLGIGLGALSFGMLEVAHVRLLVGAIALSFVGHYWWRRRQAPGSTAAPVPQAAGLLGGAGAGFTSFIAHAGGPPISLYLLRRPLNKSEFVATTAMFFAVVNYVKLVPYAWLGQLSADNLTASLVLTPLAPIGIAIGVWLHNRISDRVFFRWAYLLLFVVSLKLLSDGLGGL